MPQPGRAVLLTGLPGSGKSTIAAGVRRRLREKGVRVEVVSSEDVRQTLLRPPTYSDEEKAIIYRGMIWAAALLTKNGSHVILDATFNKQMFRDWARAKLPHVMEVLVKCSLAECMRRDGERRDNSQYKKALEHRRYHLMPGLGAPFEESKNPDLVVETDQELVEASVVKVLAAIEKHFQFWRVHLTSMTIRGWIP